MARYLARRLLATLPLFFLMPLLTFFLMRLVPGNYFDSLRMNPQISAETIQRYEALYHLDKPVLVQFAFWVRNLFLLDFGYSFAYRQPVLNILGSRLANTLLLTGTAFTLAWLLAVPLGLWAAGRRGGLLDLSLRGLAYAALSLPSFFLCLLLLAWAARSGHLPLGGMRSVDYELLAWPERVVDVARHLVLPAGVLALGSFAHLFRIMRAQTLEVMDKEFVFFLRACRIPEPVVFFKHVARNAVNPLVTLFGMELPALFGGAALVEIFTGWPGLGSLMLQAVRSQDLFLVLGNMVMISFLLVLGNLLSDLLLAAVDPRIRMRAAV